MKILNSNPLIAPKKAPDDQNFTRERFRREDASESLDSFAEGDGVVYRKKLGLFKEELTGDQASQRLTDYDGPKPVYVELPDGKVHKLRSLEEIQDLDTFQGLGLKPSAPEPVVTALRALDKGVDANDGIFRDGFAFTPEKRLNGFETYGALTSPGKAPGKAALKGAGLGAAIGLGVGLAAAGASLLFPSLLPGLVNPVALLAVGGGTVLGGAAIGAGTNFVTYQNAHPKEVEVRNGQDFGLKLRTLDHAVETNQWLEERAQNPFTEDQQSQAIENLAQESGLYRGDKKIDAEEALKRLKEGKSVDVPSKIPGHKDTLTSIRHLQQMDTVRGLGLNPVLPADVSTSLGYLEAGVGAKDGLYERGGVERNDRLSAFQAVDYLFREREPIAVRVRDKNYQTKELKNIQELNALKGDGINTILPEGPFQSLLFFDESHLMKTESEMPKEVDSYESLQEMNEGRAVTVASEGRDARSLEPADLHELKSLEFDKSNDILPQRDFDLLNYWQDNGGYRVNGETANQHGYEALQSVQSEDEFEIESAGRFAPALTFQDLEDLATFEAPDAGFPNSVPPIDQDRLTYFQEHNEADGKSGVNVGGREGRAYEGYRELRDGKPFDVQAGAVWNSVTSSQALHDLDALLGRGVNDILPQNQYDLLKHLGDGAANEGLATGGLKLNSYAALQEFRSDRPISYDFHGGDFGELLQIPTENLEELQPTKDLRDNQKEYDKYAYPVPEWKDKMDRQFARTPDLGRENLAYGEANLSRGRSKLRRGESDLSSAESDLRSARSDLSYAESELSRARSLPTYITKYRQVCETTNGNRNCRQESYQEYNHQRSSAISRAESHVADAERKIRRAKSDISHAERLISQARADIREAEGEISDANRLLSLLSGYSQTLSSANDGNYQNVADQLKSTLDAMKPLSHVSSLDTNLRHQVQLISNMANRPKRPEEWTIPQPLVQS